jgi:hypothetical protein
MLQNMGTKDEIIAVVGEGKELKINFKQGARISYNVFYAMASLSVILVCKMVGSLERPSTGSHIKDEFIRTDIPLHVLILKHPGVGHGFRSHAQCGNELMSISR